MSKRFYILIFCFLSLFSGFSANAQKLSTLAPDGAVTFGKLPDGLQYAIVTSAAEKGRSEYAILQRACQDEKKAPYRLRRLGSFSSVKGGQSQDSVLFRMVSEVKASIDECDSLYGTDNQTLIIIGDVDKNSVIEKLRLFTYMVPASASKAKWENPYKWEDHPLEAEVYPEEGFGIAKVNIAFLAPRPKAERLNTIVPTVSYVMAESLGEITRRRLEDIFSALDLPVANLTVSQTSPTMTEGSPSLNINFAVSEDNLGQSIALVAGTITEIGEGGVQDAEIVQVFDTVLERFRAEASKPLTNEWWLTRIVSNQITGTDLATPATKLKLFTEKAIADSTIVSSINSIAAATFVKDENILISVSGGTMTPGAIEKTFTESRPMRGENLHKGFVALQSAGLPAASPKKVKPKKTVAEKTFGGTEFQFPNGLRVMYKQMATGGKLYWSAALGGGTSSLEGAVAGESAFLGDIFSICRINGFAGRDFLRLMESKGMTADCDLRFDDCVISGVADSKDPELFFRFLLSILNNRTDDEAAYDYYEKCESLGSRIYAGSHVMDRLESSLQPGYAFSEYKTGDILADDFYERAERFYSKRFSSMNDGALIVIGDITEYKFLTALRLYAGQFRTSNSRHTRPSVSFRLLSGERNLPAEYDIASFRMAASGLLETTLDNRHAADVADRMLSKVLSTALKDSGWRIKSKIYFISEPKGHVNMRITAHIDTDSGVEAIDAAELKKIILRELKALAEGRFQPGEPAASKSETSTALAQKTATPAYWLWIGEEKVTNTKDYNTGSAAKLSGLSNDRIKNVFSALYNGGRIVL